MNSGFGCFDGGFSHRSRRTHRSLRTFRSRRTFRGNNIAGFLRRLSPGTRVVLQYNDQPPASGIFEGFQNGTVILTNFNGFPGLVRIAVNSINAVSVATSVGPGSGPGSGPGPGPGPGSVPGSMSRPRPASRPKSAGLWSW